MEEPKIGAEFSICAGEELEMSTNATFPLVEKMDENNYSVKEEKVGSVSASASASINVEPSSTQRDENTSKVEESVNTSSIEVDKGRKTSACSKNHRMKRKVKVDWTPELHKQFVQVVEQLGVDKAVPSKILKLMGIDCLTRHNVASHLQKYRSHRKHLLAREAEAASWNRRRRTYGTDGRTGKKDLSSCVPATGFPPVTQMPHFKPLHVWGHPWTNQSWMYGWSEPSLLPNDPSYWYYHHQYAFPGPPVPGIPSNSIYRVEPGVGISTGLSAQALPQPPCDFHLSKECIDTAVGDVLSKRWLPLPLGLKPPSMDSVMAELQRQGISKIQSDFA